MKVIVNGEPRDVTEDASVADVVASVTQAPSGVAVAVNGELVTRSTWTSTPLRETDRLDVVAATQGG